MANIDIELLEDYFASASDSLQEYHSYVIEHRCIGSITNDFTRIHHDLTKPSDILNWNKHFRIMFGENYLECKPLVYHDKDKGTKKRRLIQYD